MKLMLFSLATIFLVSCNTTIGVWRDTKAGYNWTANKVKGAGSGGGGGDYGGTEYEYGAPVY